MTFLGLTLSEIAILTGLLTSGVSAIIFLLKVVIISPLDTTIKGLEKSIAHFSALLEESKRDRETLHRRVNKLDKRVTVLEEHDRWEEKKG